MYSDRHLWHLQGEPTLLLFGLTTRIEYLSPSEKKNVCVMYMYTLKSKAFMTMKQPFCFEFSPHYCRSPLGQKHTNTRCKNKHTQSHVCKHYGERGSMMNRPTSHFVSAHISGTAVRCVCVALCCRRKWQHAHMASSEVTRQGWIGRD